ncbi:tail fiber protein [Olleya sp. YS]|uniref:phage tail protein n=1 Tax=Olleya sp. YS TaxID=3028318 RepID=UPI0024344581|nr:tail fiber protein [Olleya sp. YS]WGD35551.1 tail fiber protein [Olleya sp. YS]
MEPFIAQIMLFGGNFAPRGWAFCHGQLLPISQNTALFSLIGTTYGGDGRTTFGLPDLRGRVPLSVGQGPGLSNITWGERGGAEQHTITINEMPTHAHDGSSLTGVSTMTCSEDDGTTEEPAGNVLATAASGTPYVSGAANETLGSTGTVTVSGNTGNQGGNQPMNLRTPYVGINYVIALQGIFPSRS